MILYCNIEKNLNILSRVILTGLPVVDSDNSALYEYLTWKTRVVDLNALPFPLSSTNKGTGFILQYPVGFRVKFDGHFDVIQLQNSTPT